MKLFPVTEQHKKWVDEIWEEFIHYRIKLTPDEINAFEICRNNSVYSRQEQKIINEFQKKS